MATKDEEEEKRKSHTGGRAFRCESWPSLMLIKMHYTQTLVTSNIFTKMIAYDVFKNQI